MDKFAFALVVTQVVGMLVGWHWLREPGRDNRHGLVVLVALFGLVFGALGMLYYACLLVWQLFWGAVHGVAFVLDLLTGNRRG